MQKGDETNSYKCLDSASIKQQKRLSKNPFFSKTLWSALSLKLQNNNPVSVHLFVKISTVSTHRVHNMALKSQRSLKAFKGR